MMKLASIFSDNLVLQQQSRCPVWGTAAPGAAIQVRLLLESQAVAAAATVAGGDGAWKAYLPPLAAGGPYELAVAAGDDEIQVCRDVMVGEVWVCSGQSNMEWTVANSTAAAVEIAAADFPKIRMIKIPRIAQVEPLRGFSASWQVCSPETVGEFSAAGYFFARELQQRLGVAVGMINSSWGGTIAEAWTSRQGLESEPLFRPLISKLDEILAVPREQRTTDLEGREFQVPQDPGNSGSGNGWAALETDCGAWQTMSLPQSWQFAGFDISGVFWFRRQIQAPAAWAGRDLELHIGACDKDDSTYYNNEKVGSLGMAERADAWCTPRVYTVPGRLVKAGASVIAVRVFSNVFQGGMIGPDDEMWIAPVGAAASERISLAGDWRFRIEHDFGKIAPPPPTPLDWGNGNPHTPAVLFNGLIAPLIPYAICGAIWYQGESNAGRPTEYRTLFPAMIRDWRRLWGRDEFPFYFVQLANYKKRNEMPGESDWAELREAQRLTLNAVPNTGMAVIIDIGEAEDIHPKNKQDVGARLARLALKNTYGADIIDSGPTPLAALVTDAGQVILRLADAADGIGDAGSNVSGFAIAGSDRSFRWATAVIDTADTLILSAPEVPAPCWVRYAWADNPDCGLRNSEALPATPFELPLPYGPWQELLLG